MRPRNFGLFRLSVVREAERCLGEEEVFVRDRFGDVGSGMFSGLLAGGGGCEGGWPW